MRLCNGVLLLERLLVLVVELGLLLEVLRLLGRLVYHLGSLLRKLHELLLLLRILRRLVVRGVLVRLLLLRDLLALSLCLLHQLHSVVRSWLLRQLLVELELLALRGRGHLDSLSGGGSRSCRRSSYL